MVVELHLPAGSRVSKVVDLKLAAETGDLGDVVLHLELIRNNVGVPLAEYAVFSAVYTGTIYGKPFSLDVARKTFTRRSSLKAIQAGIHHDKTRGLIEQMYKHLWPDYLQLRMKSRPHGQVPSIVLNGENVEGTSRHLRYARPGGRRIF